MRAWLLILMIALLPIRGWVGNAMAGELLSHRVAVGAAATAHAHHGWGLHQDCMAHGQSPADTEAKAQADASTTSSCASCQVFSSVALVFADAMPHATSFQSPRPFSAEARFASADRAPGFKPPIS